MRIQTWVRVSVIILASVGILCADTVVDSFNIGEPLANITWGTINDIGWYYTPSTSYTLDQIETIFNGGTNRTITVDVFTDTPANGGTSLGSATFDTINAQGTLDGPSFSGGIALTGGTTYFVALENIDGLGVNQVSFSTSNGENGPTGSVAPGTEWQDDGDQQFGTEGCSDLNNWFCKPEIEFLEQSSVSPVPEPRYGLFLVAAAGLLVALRARKQRSLPS